MNRSAALPRFPFAHTYSIVARDPLTGDLGVAVQSHWFSTGSIVTWAEPGVGAIATQAMVEVSYGPKGMAGLRQGIDPQIVLNDLLVADEGRELRQVTMLDCKGRVATHTGNRCIAEAGHQIGKQFSVQSNMMLKNTVWPAMAKAFDQANGSLPERMLATLEAAQGEGGDIRGMQSAAMLVVSGNKNDHPWTETIVDLRVEDHPMPLVELRRLFTLQRAYESMNLGDALLGAGKVEEAMLAYQEGVRAAPEVKELPFWQAVTLADTGRLKEALPIFKDVFNDDQNWMLLLLRLPAAGLLKDDPEMIAQIKAIASK
ncbi:MAG: DUF1028 domain-containing protein [Anaerolineaceae bacterium]